MEAEVRLDTRYQNLTLGFNDPRDEGIESS